MPLVNTAELGHKVIRHLSTMIHGHLVSMRAEMTHPTNSGDQMDAKIDYHRARANDLRYIRTQIEDLVTQVEP